MTPDPVKLCIPKKALLQHLVVLGKTGAESGLAPAIAASRSAVVGLLFRCGPSTVARLVITVVVGVAVNGMSRARARAHVPQKRFETVSPETIDFDSTAPVFHVVDRLEIVAAILHSLPRVILGRLALAVGSICGGCIRGLSAAASVGFLPEMILPNPRGFTAVAYAIPESVLALSGGFAFNDEHPEPLTNHDSSSAFHNCKW